MAEEVVLPQLRRMWWEMGVEARGEAGITKVAKALPVMVMAAMRLAWRADRFGTGATVVLTIFSGVLATVGLLTTQQVLIEVFGSGPTGDRLASALPALVLLAAVTGLRAALGITVGWVQTGLEPKVVQSAQRQLFEVTTQVEVSAFDEESFADEMERATGRGTDSTMGLVEATLNLMAGLIGIVAVVVALAVLHPLLLVVTVAAMVPTAWAAMHAGQQQYRAYLASSVRRRRLWILNRLMADRRPAVELRAYGLRGFLLHQFDVVMGAETRHQLRLAKKVTVTNTIGSAIGGVAALGVYAVLAWLLVSGRMPLAAGATAIVALQSARHSLSLASFQVDALYSEGRHFRDFETFLKRAHTRVADVQGSRDLQALRSLAVNNVTLAYPDREAAAVAGVSLTLLAGQTIALVGENGSGKTTLAALMCGLRRPDSGSVTWNGEDVSTLDLDLLRKRIAVITQEHHHWPFTATVNIRLGDTARDAGPEPIEEAARRAAAHEMIMELPRGYDTLLDRTFEGGQDLSGGQWQRLIAARGFFRDADLLIMDEPSSALDAKAEDQLFSVVRERRGKATTILITHRLANVRHADRIYVMDRGRLIAEGNHDDLMAHADPTYRDLFELQAAGYTQEGSLGIPMPGAARPAGQDR